MKRYIKPFNRIINLETENAILSGSNEANVYHEEATEEALTDKKNIWGNESIWK